MEAVDPWPNPENPTFDNDGIMLPPWIKYPNLPKESMGWRMGQGEDYMEQYLKWYYANPRSKRVEIMNKYKTPEDWSEFYKA